MPIVTQTAERRDAARNRQILLDAAKQILDEQGIDALTMDTLACQAGVGKGTVFRRFGSRAGLLLALLGQSDTQFQTAFMFGPPPLGPGAPAAERLVAFGWARLRLLSTDRGLHRAAEADPSDAYYGGPSYRLLRQHVAILVQEIGIPSDTMLIADMLLAPLDAKLVTYQEQALGYDIDQIGAQWEILARMLISGSSRETSDSGRQHHRHGQRHG
ncbi:helix-turn-helix domain-containing protein [Nocardia sp. NPDC004604]|uniref:TetR/AcrR family transcriptional regulator n=1 Tax=Nocardia sp. NPDC004604 TaxID=3157013 RepID=UPI0033BAB6A9